MFRSMLFGVSLCLAAAGTVLAQAYPSKPVRVVVGYPPGGSVDVVGRIIAQKLAESMGQPFVVENKPGASSNIGADFVARSAPDGYTLLMGGTPLGSNPAIYTRMPYSPVKDLAPVVMMVRQANVLVVNPAVPARTVQELVTLAKTKPLSYGSGGNGTTQHMSAALFQKMASLDMLHVPYKGGAPAISDLVGGQIDLMFAPVPEALGQIKAGKLRALAVSTLKRSAVMSDVPTVDESGLPGFELDGWMGFAVPAGTPQEIVVRLNVEINKILAMGEVKTRLLDLGLDIVGGPPEVMGKQIQQQITKMTALVKDAGIPRID